jgi:hypothetical protein
MSDTLQSLLWVLGLPILGIALVLLAVGVEWAVRRLESASAHFEDWLSASRAGAEERHMEKQDTQDFLGWLGERSGTAASNGAVDNRLLQAQRQSELIKILVEGEVPKAASRCLETHRTMAKITGAHKFSEVANEPECYQLRRGMVWLLAHTVQFVESYPFRLDDARLVHNSILLRKRALSYCQRCPYIELEVNTAPPRCPTAELF